MDSYLFCVPRNFIINLNHLSDRLIFFFLICVTINNYFGVIPNFKIKFYAIISNNINTKTV